MRTAGPTAPDALVPAHRRRPVGRLVHRAVAVVADERTGRRAARAAESRPLRRVPAAGPVRTWTLWELALGAGGLGSAVVVGWAVGTVRRRPRGRDVVARMSYGEVAPAAGAASTPVVLVHGLGMSSRSMRPLLGALGASTRTLAPDLPGYGRSPQPRVGMLGVDDLARAVLAWMDERQVGSAVLVGHSVGAQVAGQVALLAPERVRRLVVLGPTGDPERPSVLRQALRLLGGVLHEPPRLVGIAVLDYLRAGPGQMVVLMRRAVQLAQQQGDVTVPVPLLVVRGSRDEVCTQAWCEQIVASTAGSRLVVVEDSAHGIAYDAPAELVDLLLAEVAEADRAAATDGRPPTDVDPAPPGGPALTPGAAPPSR